MPTNCYRSIAVFVAIVLLVAAVAPTLAAAGESGVHSTALDCEYPYTTVDATGTEVTIDEPPERVVALGPSDAQTVYEIGAEDRLVGYPISDAFTGYLEPGDREDITQDDGLTVESERVVALEPDIVIAANAYLYQEGLIDELRDAGLEVYVFDVASSIDDIQNDVHTTGELVGECEGAEETVTWMDERLEFVETAVEDEDRPLVYYAQGDGYTTGTDSFQHEMLETAGVENIAERAGIHEGWGLISEETITEEDPGWIIYHEELGEPPLREGESATTAVTSEQFVAVDGNFMSQPGPRIVLVVEEIATTVHPDAYEAAVTEDGDDASDGVADETGDGVDDDTDDGASTETDDGTVGDGESDQSESIPGFGPVGAIAGVFVALIGLLTAARRP